MLASGPSFGAGCICVQRQKRLFQDSSEKHRDCHDLHARTGSGNAQAASPRLRPKRAPCPRCVTTPLRPGVHPTSGLGVTIGLISSRPSLFRPGWSFYQRLSWGRWTTRKAGSPKRRRLLVGDSRVTEVAEVSDFLSPFPTTLYSTQRFTFTLTNGISHSRCVSMRGSEENVDGISLTSPIPLILLRLSPARWPLSADRCGLKCFWRRSPAAYRLSPTIRPWRHCYGRGRSRIFPDGGGSLGDSCDR
jgi:hypothetical protein